MSLSINFFHLIKGYTKAEVVGKDVKILMPEPYASQHDSYIQNHLHTGIRKVIGTIRLAAALRKNGQVFPISLSISRVDMEEEGSYFMPKFPLFAAFIRETQYMTNNIDDVVLFSIFNVFFF